MGEDSMTKPSKEIANPKYYKNSADQGWHLSTCTTKIHLTRDALMARLLQLMKLSSSSESSAHPSKQLCSLGRENSAPIL